MAASQNDKFLKSGASTVTTLSAPGKALAATSINVGSTTNYSPDTGIVFAIRQVDSEGELIAGTYTEWIGTVTSGTTLAMNGAPVYGSDQVYPAGSTTQVYIPVSSYALGRMVDGLLVAHNQDGTLKTNVVIATDSATLTTPKVVTSINDSNGNEIIKTPATTSAVNELTITNAATGNSPDIAATGGDTNIGITLTPKGTGALTLNRIYQPYKFMARLTTGTPTTGNNAFGSAVNFNSEDYDTSNNLSAGVFTAPVAGFYEFGWATTVGSGATGQGTVSAIHKNGTRNTDGNWSYSSAASQQIGSSGIAQLQLAASDTVDIRVFATTTLNLTVSSNACTFWGRLVSIT